MYRMISVWTLALLSLALSAARGEDLDLVLLPDSATLQGSKASQRFLAELQAEGAFVGDQTAKTEFSISNPNIAQVSADGVVTPVADGLTTLSATSGDRTARALIEVRGMGEPFHWSFRNHVQAVLTRSGCNSGGCHGAEAGKNGFRLTLRGYGPEVDYDVLTRQAKARRIDKTAPQESLFLLKATGAVEHGGGVRFTVHSPEYRVIAEWIAAGLPPPAEDDPKLVEVLAIPQAATLQPGQEQQILVQAVYSDGRTEDVTRWARFESTDEMVAQVEESGRLTVQGHGEGAIAVGFSSLVDLVTVTVPYESGPDPKVFAQAPKHNQIDVLNLAKLQAIGLPPSPIADDATFLRRAFLDATGTLPSVEAVEAFLADPDPEKRRKLVDRLLKTEAYIDYWTYKWSDLFLVSSRNLPKPAMWAFYREIRENVAENTPWNQFVRRIVTAKGSTLENGAGNYFVIHRDPIELAENASMAFLGLSLTCARCHNHPLEKWTQDEYYGFANLFARVKLKDGATGAAAGDVEIVPAVEGDILHPRRGFAMAPQPLDATPQPLESREDRREAFATWLEDPENPYFARAVVNRVWANFFGKGLVDPEDDLRATNPPSDPALLDWLVEDFRANGYDLQHLIRTIMTSATYARSSDPVPGDEADSKFLSRYPVKRLPAEVLLDALSQVTAVPTPFPGYPEGWRSLQLPDVQVESTFLSSFGRPERESTCSCERSAEPSLSQALHLANGATLNDKLRADDGAVAEAATSEKSLEMIIDHLFKSSLSRPPMEAEVARLLPILNDSVEGAKGEEAEAARRQAIEDLYWAVLTGKEFLFNR